MSQLISQIKYMQYQSLGTENGRCNKNGKIRHTDRLKLLFLSYEIKRKDERLLWRFIKRSIAEPKIKKSFLRSSQKQI